MLSALIDWSGRNRILVLIATLFINRLRRRIEKATPVAVPLQSQQKVGYQFRAPLIAA